MTDKQRSLVAVESLVPKVSIGMPVYNGEKFIREALDSLLTQTFTDFELIISDNASTDRTEAICREYAERDQRIRYLRQIKNFGPDANFKCVLNEAIGMYFMWAAHDDRRHPIAIERMMEVFALYDNVGLVFSNMDTSDLNTGVKVNSFVGYAPPVLKKYQKYIFRLINSCPSLIYGLHRTSLLRKIPLSESDFMDVYLTHWYELNSSIFVIPLNLYTAGTDGVRIPYSLNGKKISAKEYLRAEWVLLRSNFGFFGASILYLMTAFLMQKNIKCLQKDFGI
ncbi:MAG: glycosyltransferase [Gammaproteobacteria bacterium]|nr:glycosyltransferase [Gammaproteobacteria bacterium]